MSSKTAKKNVTVTPEELVFLFQHCTPAVKNVIFNRIKPNRPKLTKRKVANELTTLKKHYDNEIISTARLVLKENFNKVFTQS